MAGTETDGQKGKALTAARNVQAGIFTCPAGAPGLFLSLQEPQRPAFFRQPRTKPTFPQRVPAVMLPQRKEDFPLPLHLSKEEAPAPEEDAHRRPDENVRSYCQPDAGVEAGPAEPAHQHEEPDKERNFEQGKRINKKLRNSPGSVPENADRHRRHFCVLPIKDICQG